MAKYLRIDQVFVSLEPRRKLSLDPIPNSASIDVHGFVYYCNKCKGHHFINAMGLMNTHEWILKSAEDCVDVSAFLWIFFRTSKLPGSLNTKDIASLEKVRVHELPHSNEVRERLMKHIKSEELGFKLKVAALLERNRGEGMYVHVEYPQRELPRRICVMDNDLIIQQHKTTENGLHRHRTVRLTTFKDRLKIIGVLKMCLRAKPLDEGFAMFQRDIVNTFPWLVDKDQVFQFL